MNRKWPIPRPATRDECMPLIEAYHPYKGAGKSGQWWACEENGVVDAAFQWMPPLPSAASAVAPGCPHGVLSLARMVASPREERAWHISKPLKWLMRNGLDRERWPVLVTYSDAGQGHSGHVYKCSGWLMDGTRSTPNYEDDNGTKRSIRSAGQTVAGLTKSGKSDKTRWVHRACPMGQELEHMHKHGWRHVPIPGKTWASGNQAFTWVKLTPLEILMEVS